MTINECVQLPEARTREEYVLLRDTLRSRLSDSLDSHSINTYLAFIDKYEPTYDRPRACDYETHKNAA